MNSRHLFRIALFTAAVSFGTLATAATKDAASAPKGTGTAQTHHCKQADGTMDMGKTRKACVAAKGTWLKDAAATAPAAVPAPAATASMAARK